ncbi:M12 family metallopeptidase [Leptospira sp. WS92.C1]
MVYKNLFSNESKTFLHELFYKRKLNFGIYFCCKLILLPFLLSQSACIYNSNQNSNSKNSDLEFLTILIAPMIYYSQNEMECQTVGTVPIYGNESIRNDSDFLLTQKTNPIAGVGEFDIPKGRISAPYNIDASGEFVVGGDMIFKNQTPISNSEIPIRNYSFGVPNAGLWTGKTVPYTIDPSLEHVSRITRAIDYYDLHTEIRFIPRTGEADYVNFRDNDSGCSSKIGKIGGMQNINIDDVCGVASVIHEMGHAIGLLHEHQRPDRDNFIDIFWSNLTPSATGNLGIWDVTGSFTGVTYAAYDHCSIMHYGSYTSFNRTYLYPMLVTKEGKTIPYHAGMTQTDVQTIRNLYDGI